MTAHFIFTARFAKSNPSGPHWDTPIITIKCNKGTKRFTKGGYKEQDLVVLPQLRQTSDPLGNAADRTPKQRRGQLTLELTSVLPKSPEHSSVSGCRRSREPPAAAADAPPGRAPPAARQWDSSVRRSHAGADTARQSRGRAQHTCVPASKTKPAALAPAPTAS